MFLRTNHWHNIILRQSLDPVLSLPSITFPTYLLIFPIDRRRSRWSTISGLAECHSRNGIFESFFFLQRHMHSHKLYFGGDQLWVWFFICKPVQWVLIKLGVRENKLALNSFVAMANSLNFFEAYCLICHKRIVISTLWVGMGYWGSGKEWACHLAAVVMLFTLTTFSLA